MSLALGGCALITAPKFDAVVDHPSTELAEVPFFPQKKYQCGPAAVATLLAHRGEPVTADDLVDEVYTPGREGSLQPDLVTAVRRRGLVAYASTGHVGILDDALAAGTPAVVLLNLSSRVFPMWHYAVVIGTDNDRHRVIMRSGRNPDRRMSWWRFERAWFLSNYWALMALPPDQVPPFADPVDWLGAVQPWEAARPEQAGQAYAAAAAHWPELAAPWVALGNVDAGAGRPQAALAAYAEALAREPDQPIAINNAADQLGAIGCPTTGITLLEAALARLAEARWRETLQTTLAELRQQEPDPTPQAQCADWRQRLVLSESQPL